MAASAGAEPSPSATANVLNATPTRDARYLTTDTPCLSELCPSSAGQYITGDEQQLLRKGTR